jgi:hypothetical protein
MKKPIERVNAGKSVKKVIATTKALMDNGAIQCHISNGNVKLDGIKNISLPPVVTCGANCKECKNYCYAIKSFNRLPVVAAAWVENYALYLNNPNQYFAAIKTATAIERVFRWHVSGDIVDYNYFIGMVDVATRNKYCEYLAFTKQYDIVNKAINDGVVVPDNLHLIYSASPGVKMDNPHGLPECHINFADNTKNTYNADHFKYTYHCTGNCRECVVNGCGCFFLKNGDAVVINQH